MSAPKRLLLSETDQRVAVTSTVPLALVEAATVRTLGCVEGSHCSPSSSGDVAMIGRTPCAVRSWQL